MRYLKEDKNYIDNGELCIPGCQITVMKTLIRGKTYFASIQKYIDEELTNYLPGIILYWVRHTFFFAFLLYLYLYISCILSPSNPYLLDLLLKPLFLEWQVPLCNKAPIHILFYSHYIICFSFGDLPAPQHH